jgi:trans-aconitate methyltransferase
VNTTAPANAPWDAARYDRQFGYVSHLAGGVVELLAPAPGERVLDLGCGTGELAATISRSGAGVLAMDSDPAMVAAATERLGRPAVLADGHDFTLDEPVDAVFSNAALHWMTEPARVLASVRRALRPGGRFVAEMGGARNVATIIAAVRRSLDVHGHAAGFRMPWYFPGPQEYTALLEAAGFRVAEMSHFPRPTPLHECPGGVADWVRMFGAAMVGHVPASAHHALYACINELAADELLRDGVWHADYWRLRFVAVAADR